MRHSLRLTAAAIAFAAATPALAQESAPQSEDWALTSAPEHKAVIAMIDFTSVWTVGAQRNAAFSRIPAVIARDLAKGGTLQVIVPATSKSPRTRYVMELDPSSTAIEQTLTACGRPMVDPREVRSDEIDGNGQDGLPASVAWQTVPRPTFPESVNGRSPVEGYVVLSCVADARGELTECVTESEQPAGYNLGLSVERSLPRARIKLTDEAAVTGRPLAGRMIRFAVNFKMER
ncbi:MAG: hypothetical protein ACK4NU_01085 [Brevundimonas sp.]